jgi:hydrogenase/urease accessory protein HupE
MRSWLLLSLLLCLLAARTAHAHAIGVSRGDYLVSGAKVTANLVFARGEMKEPSLRGVLVTADGAICDGVMTESALTEEDGVRVRGVFTCAAPPSRVSISLPLLEELSHGHRHVARIVSGATAVDDVLYRDHETMDIGGQVAPSPGALAFVKMGIEHILTGADHLVFLFGLIVVGGRLRSLLGVVTAFTVGHSITLAMAVLGLFTPSSRVIEPAIALSIAYVGVENFFVKDASKRWRITLPFGLVHGFGFAGALQEIALPRAQVPAALLSFNLGVELGQILVLALALPLALLLRRKQPYTTRAVSAAIVLAGIVWFVARVTTA